MNGWIPVLQPLDKLSCGKAEPIPIQLHMHLRHVLAIAFDERQRRAGNALQTGSDLLAQPELPFVSLIVILLEEDPERGQEADNLLLAALGNAPNAARGKAHDL